uniref:Hydroxymethylglutaryl-coenzyme A synthase C-terminal domain-containing protein n=1 Tax=Ditylenchus dipsaci TaxID=166011 RepID=A0A915E9N5_9BILA
MHWWAGAIAFLIGPKAPLVLERGLRGVFARNVYDFYKPIGGQSTEYALVNGQNSVELYLSAVDSTYEVYRQKCHKILGQNRCVADFYSVLFHSPFTKLVQKAFGRLVFRDFERNETYTKHWNRTKEVSMEETLSREFSTAAMQFSQPLMEHKLNAHLEFNKRLGNMYTPSVYAQLINLIYNNPTVDALNNQKVLVFSYGSGCIAAMYSLKIDTSSAYQQHSYLQMVGSAQRAHRRLHQRVKQSPRQFAQALMNRQALIAIKGAYTPISSAKQTYFPGAYYLREIDEKACRSYGKVEK